MSKQKVPASHRAKGIILIVFSSLLCSLFVGVFVEGEYGLIVPAVVGLICLFFGISICRGKFMGFEDQFKRNGIYLNQDQVEKLEQKYELPIVDTPVYLNSGEVAVYYSQAIRVVGKQRFIGEMVITTQRTVFLCDVRGFEIKHQKVTSSSAYKDGLSIQSRNTNYILIIPRVDLVRLAFDGVRTGEIPIASSVKYDDSDLNHDNINQCSFVTDDVAYVDGMDGHEFEYFCADLLSKNGFSEISVTRGSGDQGVDVLATKGGVKYAIQCKNYSSPLSNTPVQEVSAGKLFYNCHVGVVLTNSTFTPGAISLAQATGVLLWDRSTLSELMRNNGCHVQNTERVVTSQPQNAVQPVFPSADPMVVMPKDAIKRKTVKTPVRENHIQIDNIGIDIDVVSVERFGIVLENFGVEIDEDDDDQVELLFDIVCKNGRRICCDVDIVCNLYAGGRKVITERESVFKDDFDGRDSVSVYFDKKNIAKTATRIEIFCQKW